MCHPARLNATSHGLSKIEEPVGYLARLTHERQRNLAALTSVIDERPKHDPPPKSFLRPTGNEASGQRGFAY